jgi:hypothetical protein
LHLRVPQHFLHSLRIFFRLIHQPVAQRVPQVVKAEAMTIGNLKGSDEGRWTQMILIEGRSRNRNRTVLRG